MTELGSCGRFNDNNSFIFLRNPATSIFSFKLVTENEIYQVKKCLIANNSCGSDGISSKLIKYIINELSMTLTVIINQMFTTGIFPDNLKTAKIHPSKNFEKIMFNQSTNYFSLNNILTDS